jgi:N6-L-threonylcarbamoyladenine synthase
MLTLGIETSCDETSVALLEGERRLLSHLILSQMEHEAFGGVVPELASRAHQKILLPMVDRALAESGRRLEEIDLIGVTVGPGLIGSLLVGLCTAKSLALCLDRPLVAVNHLEAHLMANLLLDDPPEPPFVALLVSGGHTLLVEVSKWGEYYIMGRTRDDAVGESFDKVAKMLELGYPGGPAIERAARLGRPESFSLPRPMIRNESLDMSFSGLKTAVLHEVEDLVERDVFENSVKNLAASFQAAVVEVLIDKSMRACRRAATQTLVIAGGVARNQALREKLDEACGITGIRAIFPPLSLCTDNAAMVARTAVFHHAHGRTDNLEASSFATGKLVWPTA